MLPLAPIFLLIDDNRDRRSLLVRTIRRKFPSALVRECADADTALACVKEGIPDAVVLHHAVEQQGVSLLNEIRSNDPMVPIVFLSVGEQTRAEVEATGAHFLNYDAWLNIGTLLENLLRTPTPKPAPVTV